MSNVLVVGATSSISRAFAEEMCKNGAAVHLVARDNQELERIASDLKIRHQAKVSWSALEIQDLKLHKSIIDESIQQLGGTIDGVFIAVGELGEQSRTELDPLAAAMTAEINYVGPVSILTIVANYLQEKGSGWIACLSSVAGDRGRPSNYVYGSSKGALSIFLQGLRARMFKHGVHVMTVKPGFVDTKMTFGKPGMFLVADPAYVARSIVGGLKAKRDVLYVPPFWWLIMTIIRSIPEPVFKRMKL